MNSSSPVCRTCLGIISDGKTFYNIDDENGVVKNVRNIRDMLTFCVPEMDIFISVSPSICETCLGTLVGVYNFKIRCLRVENAIRSYIVANNVMEGSCVDLSNVVKLQITEALKQKNWPQEVIRDYISKVDSCLKLSRKNNTVPSGVFNAMSQSFNSPMVSGNASGNVMPPQSQPSVVPVPPHVLQSSLRPAQLAYSPSNRPESNSVLNQLLTSSHDASKDTQPQNLTLSRRYISVSKNLMPTKQQQQPTPLFSRLEISNPSPNPNVLYSVGLTPNLPCPEPPNYHVAFHTFPTIENIQKGLLNATNTGEREEAVLVTPQAKPPKNNRITTSKRGAAKNPLRAPRKENPVQLCPVTGTICEVKSDQTGLKSVVRSYPGPKSRRKSKKIGSDDTVIIDDDDDERRKDNDEVLIMNFDEEDDHVGAAGSALTLAELLKSSVTPTTSTEATTAKSTQSKEVVVGKVPTQSKEAVVKLLSQPKRMVVKLPQIDKETLKRKLTPETVIDEIQSKRKRLVVNLNPSLPYLHTNKTLIVKLRKETFYKCLLCNYTTIETGDLKVHYERSHRLCKLCDFKCNKKSSLNEHIALRHVLDLQNAIQFYEGEKTEFHCYLCKFVGLSVLDLRDHRLRVHIKCNEVGFYKCPFASCDMEDAIAYNVLRHTEGKHDNPRRKECPLCNHMATSYQALKMHVQSHSLVQKVTCPLCPSTVAQLQRHMRKKHPEVSQEGYESGMVYGPTSDSHENLTTDEDGRIILNKPTLSAQASNPPINVETSAPSLGLVSFSEMFCSQMLQEIPEQEDDCTIVDDTARPGGKPASKRRRVILNKHNKKPQKTVNDSDDCVIISDGQRGIMTVDLSDDDNVRTKTNGHNGDVIEIIDEDPSEAAPQPSNVCLDTLKPSVSTRGEVESSSADTKNSEDKEKDDGSKSDETSSQLLEELLNEHFSESTSAGAQINETSPSAAGDAVQGVVEDTSSTSPTKLNNDDETNGLTDKTVAIQRDVVSDAHDSDDNIIVSDSESEKSAVIRKRLDVELTGISPKKFRKYPSDIFQTDSEVEGDNNERNSSSISLPNDEDSNRCDIVGLNDVVPNETLSQQSNRDEVDDSEATGDAENHQKDNEGDHNAEKRPENDSKTDDNRQDAAEESESVNSETLTTTDAEAVAAPITVPPTIPESSSNVPLDMSELSQEINESPPENDSETANSESVNNETLSSIDKRGSDVGKDAEAEAPTVPESSSNVPADMSESAQEINEKKLPENDSETVDSESVNNETLSSMGKRGSDVDNDAEAEAPTVPESSSNVPADMSESAKEINEKKLPENDLETAHSESVNNETLSSMGKRGSDVDKDAEAEAPTVPESSSNVPADMSESAKEINEKKLPKNDSETADSESVNNETLSSMGKRGSDVDNGAEAAATTLKPVPIDSPSEFKTTDVGDATILGAKSVALAEASEKLVIEPENQ